MTVLYYKYLLITDDLVNNLNTIGKKCLIFLLCKYKENFVFMKFYSVVLQYSFNIGVHFKFLTYLHPKAVFGSSFMLVIFH